MRLSGGADDQTARLRAYYAARAPEYDRVYAKPERQSDLRALERWIPTRLAGRRILDVACGTGYWTAMVAPVAAEVVGVDTAESTLKVARQRVPPGRVSFRVADAYRLPADLGRFDAAFVGFWFSHVPLGRRDEFLESLARCLEPGADVVMVDNLYVEGSSHPITQRDDAGNTFQTRRLDDGSTHLVLKNFPTETELREAVAGFAVETAYRALEHYWVLSYRARGAAPAG